MTYLISIAVATLLFKLSTAEEVCYDIRGQAVREGVPMAGMRVDLWDEDEVLNPHDHMGGAITDENGYFHLPRACGDDTGSRPDPFMVFCQDASQQCTHRRYHGWCRFNRDIQQQDLGQIEIASEKICDESTPIHCCYAS